MQEVNAGRGAAAGRQGLGQVPRQRLEEVWHRAQQVILVCIKPQCALHKSPITLQHSNPLGWGISQRQNFEEP